MGLTLDERFRQGPPARGPEERRAWMTAEEKRFILWAQREQWTAARIGRALGVNEATVRRYRRQFWDRPELLLELGLIQMVGKPTEDEHQCLVCGERVIERREAQRHLLLHFLDVNIVEEALPALRRRGRKAR